MTPDEAVAACRQAGVRLVRFLYCDNGGIVRAKAAHVERLADRMRTGIGLTVAMQAMSSLDQLQPVDGMGPVGEVRLVPDPSTLPDPAVRAALGGHARRPRPSRRRALRGRPAVLPETHGHARSATTGWSCGAPSRTSSAWRRDRRGVRPHRRQPVLLDGRDDRVAGGDRRDRRRARGAVDPARAVLRRARARPAGAVGRAPPGARGRRHADPGPRDDPRRRLELRAGRLARSKPWPDQAGNGAHVHFSVWDSAGERNLFHDGARRYALSEIAERFAAGILAHTPALLALTAPSFNSFLRLLPQHWSSAFVCWGPDNREATVRVPSTFWGLEEPSTNLEFKPSDASCNPYIAFAGLIAAGLDGIERGLELPEPMLVDPATLTADERERAGAARYPEDARRGPGRARTRRGCSPPRWATRSPRPTSPCAAPSSRPTGRWTRRSSTAATSRSTDPRRARGSLGQAV